MKTFYPEIEPYAIHRFPRENHQVYVEECGNPEGLPVLFLHGGPGSGCKAYHRSFFDPARYRVVLMDQRGSGRSTPWGELEHNTTQDLLRDLDFIRRQLGIGQWLLFGGSWGATLALLYAQQHPAKVAGLVLRGTFLARERDLQWFIGDGASRIYPDRWEHLLESLADEERADPLIALHRRLTGDDELARRRAAREWALWSGQVALGNEFDPRNLHEHVTAPVVSQARIELHYAVHRYFIEDNAILDRCGRISPLPAILIHGRHDLVCPVESSYNLYRHLPNSELRILPHAGHVVSGDEMIHALVTAADEMADRLAA
jgi:proline iminopeptidase